MNEIDIRWEKYLLTRNAEHYRDVIVCMNSDLIRGSTYFGELYSLFYDFYINFLCRAKKPNEEVLQKFGLLSNTKKSLLGEFLVSDLHFKELHYSELNQKDLESLVFDGVNIKRLEDFVSIFDFDDDAKLELIWNGCLPCLFTKEDSLLLGGTFIFDGCFIAARAEQHMVFILSVQSPIDAIFFPKSGLLLKSKNLKYEIISRATKFVKNISRNVAIYNCWNLEGSSKNIVNLIRDKRPYHVIADEISGNYQLNKLSQKKIPVAFLERASFFEPDVFGSDVIPNESLQEYAADKIIFSSYYRVGDDEFYESYRNYLIRLAEEHYGENAALFENNRKVFWIGIAGGEKRAWLEEVEGLEKVIAFLKEQFDGCQFVFDGWTINHMPTESDFRNIENHENLMKKLISRCEIEEGSYVNLIGSQILKKILFANKCSFFVSCAGTPAFWPSKICKIPGFVHNSKQMINRVDNTMNMSNVSKVPLEHITDRTEDMLVNRWDYVSYSIKPEVFRVAFSQALSQHIEIR